MLSEQQRENKLWHLGKKQRRQPALKELLRVAAAAAYRSAAHACPRCQCRGWACHLGHSHFTLQFFVSLNCDFYTPTSCLFPVILHPESFPVSLNRASGAHQGMWEHLLGWPGPTEGWDEEKTGEWKLVKPPRSTQRSLAMGVASICRRDRGHETGV